MDHCKKTVRRMKPEEKRDNEKHSLEGYILEVEKGTTKEWG